MQLSRGTITNAKRLLWCIAHKNGGANIFVSPFLVTFLAKQKSDNRRKILQFGIHCL
jgi:hypothetical protein